MSISLAEVERLWREALDVDAVADGDDFFDLGGHSLTAMRVIAAVNDLADADLSVDLLLDNPTLAEFHTALVHAIARG